VLFKVDRDTVWANGEYKASELLELRGSSLGACGTSQCFLTYAMQAPLAVGAEAVVRFRANCSRTYVSRSPQSGGRFLVSYTRAASARRVDAQALSPDATNSTQSQMGRIQIGPFRVEPGEPLLTISIAGDAGVRAPCAFTYGPGRTVLRLVRRSVSIPLEGDWQGTTVAKALPGGPFGFLSEGKCAQESGRWHVAGGAPIVEECATQCVGNPQCRFFTVGADGVCIWSAACSIQYIRAVWCNDPVMGCPDPGYATYQRRDDFASSDVQCSAFLSFRGPVVRAHVYGCPHLIDGVGLTQRQSEQEGLLRGMVLAVDQEDAACYAASPSAEPCLYDLNLDYPGTRVAAYWRMKVHTLGLVVLTSLV
jgi:hypothetical protein